MTQIPVSTTYNLETSRCILRYPDLDDAPRMLSAFCSPEFPRQVPLGQIDTLEGARAMIEGTQKAWEDGSAFAWCVDHREENLLLGQASLAIKPADEENVWALAFWTHPACWGQGYAAEAAARVLEFGFLDWNVSMIWAGAALWNHGSQRVLEKIGLSYRRDNPQGYLIKGEPVAIKEYEILREEWQAYVIRQSDIDQRSKATFG